MFSSPSSLCPVLSGLFLGYAITIRPLTAVAIGAFLLSCTMLFYAYKKREIEIKKVLLLFCASAFMVFLLLLYNTLTNGHPLLFGYAKKYTTLGFLGTSQVGFPHTIQGGIVNTSNNLIGLNSSLFAWPIPSLIFIFISVCNSCQKK